MKTFMLAVALLLSGCSVLMVPHWNEREYNELTVVAAVSSSGTCSSEQTKQLSNLSKHLLYYTAYLPNNKTLNEGVVEMDKTIQELHATSQPIGGVFCSFRLRVINAMATSLAEASGRKTP